MTKIVPIVLGTVSVLLVVLLVSVGIQGQRFQKKFANEMAQRLDAEEKLITLENERQVLQADLKDVREQLKTTKEEIETLRKKMAKNLEENAILKDMLERKQTETLSP